jgi:hypothetical protein
VSKVEMVLMKNFLHLKTLLLKRMEKNQVEMVEYQVLLSRDECFSRIGSIST